MSVLLIYCQRISEHWTHKIVQLGISERTGTFSLISLAFAAHIYGHLLHWHMSSGYFCLSKFKTSLARIGNNSHSHISLLIKIQCQTHDWALYLCSSHSYQNYLSSRLWGPISFRFWKISIRTIWYSQRMAETQDQQFRPKTEFLLTCSLARIGSISYSRLSVTVFLFLFI